MKAHHFALILLILAPLRGFGQDSLMMYHELDEVVVTATRTPKKISDSPVLTQVISRKQIERQGWMDIKSLLQDEIPGLSFSEVGFGTSINLQGLGAKHILFLIDGERIAGESGNNIDYTRLNLNNVERIEIVQGAGSALYGSQAMGGVINIITRKPTDRLSLGVDLRWGTRFQKNYSHIEPDDKYRYYKTRTDMPNADGALTIGYKKKSWSTQTVLSIQTKDAYNIYDKTGSTIYYPELNKTVTKEKSSTPTNISGFTTMTAKQTLSWTPIKTLTLTAQGNYYSKRVHDLYLDNKHEYNRDLSGLFSAKYTLPNGGTWEANIHGDRYRRYTVFEQKKMQKQLVYTHTVLQPNISYRWTIGNDHELITGAEYLREVLYADKFSKDGLTARAQGAYALFVQDDWKIPGTSLSMISGLRVDYNKGYGINLSPKLALLYKVSPFTIRLNYGRGYRSPSIKELYMDWDHLGMFWIYGNKQLKPESNHYLSLTTEYTHPQLYVMLSGYYNFFTNKIEGIWSEDQKELHYRNISKSTLAGVQIQMRIRPLISLPLQIHLASHYLHPFFHDGVRLTSQAPISGTGRIEYLQNWGNHRLAFNISASVMGKKSLSGLTTIEDEGIPKETPYRITIPGYTLVRSTIAYTHPKWGTLTIGVDNILNYQADVVSFNSYAGPGRNLFMSYHFNL